MLLARFNIEGDLMDIVNRNCPECGNEHSSEDIDLWTRCEACYSLLITDDEVLELEDN